MPNCTNSDVNGVVKASIEATEAALLSLLKRSVKRQTFEYGKGPAKADVPLFPDEDSSSAASSAPSGGKSLIYSTNSKPNDTITTGTSTATSTATGSSASSTATTSTQTDVSSKKKQKRKGRKSRRRRRRSVEVIKMSDSSKSPRNKSASEDTAVEIESKRSHNASVASSGAKPAVTIVPGTTKVTPIREVTGFVVDLNVRTEGRPNMPLRVEFPGFVPKRVFDGNWRNVVKCLFFVPISTSS